MVEEDKHDVQADMEGEEEQDGEPQPDKYPNLDEKMMESIRDKFGMFSKEQGDTINREGFGTLLRYLKFNPTEPELQAYIERHSRNPNKQDVTLDQVFEIVNEKLEEPDTIDEFIEAARIFDHDNDGKIEVAELRYAMTQLGDKFDEETVDEMVAELDKEKTGFVDILEWAKVTFK